MVTQTNRRRHQYQLVWVLTAVFSAFALASIVILKSIGLGMALAIAVDATIVRALIVPATMRLLGCRNWRAPAPLARLHRRLGLDESELSTPAATRPAAAATAAGALPEAQSPAPSWLE